MTKMVEIKRKQYANAVPRDKKNVAVVHITLKGMRRRPTRKSP